MPWYIFALLAPILFSVSNYIDKFLLEKRIRDPFAITALTALFSGILGVGIGIVTGWKPIGGLGIWIAMAAGILLVLYLLPYFEALKREDASRVIPLFGFIPVFTLVLSSLFLHESLAPRQIVGIFIVVAGGFVLSLRRIEGRILRPRPALWLMLLSSVMYGVVSILFRFVARDVGFWTILSWEYIGKGVGAAFLMSLPVIRRSISSQMKGLKKSIGILLANDGIAILGQMSEDYAVTLALVLS
jgi:drug/metabolite transporter (DMT)-like permease